MAHLPRELFISLVMDSASNWVLVKVPVIEFIRNVTNLHGAKVCLLVFNHPVDRFSTPRILPATYLIRPLLRRGHAPLAH
jgi:hypothetical protein